MAGRGGRGGAHAPRQAPGEWGPARKSRDGLSNATHQPPKCHVPRPHLLVPSVSPLFPFPFPLCRGAGRPTDGWMAGCLVQPDPPLASDRGVNQTDRHMIHTHTHTHSTHLVALWSIRTPYLVCMQTNDFLVCIIDTVPYHPPTTPYTTVYEYWGYSSRLPRPRHQPLAPQSSRMLTFLTPPFHHPEMTDFTSTSTKYMHISSERERPDEERISGILLAGLGRSVHCLYCLSVVPRRPLCLAASVHMSRYAVRTRLDNPYTQYTIRTTTYTLRSTASLTSTV